MGNYEKPFIVANDELTEGIYAASGASDITGGGEDTQSQAVTYSLSIAGDWDGNKNYDVTFTNEGDSKIDTATVYMTAVGDITNVDGAVSYVGKEGDKLIIEYNNWGQGIEAHTTVGPVYMHVTGNGDFSVE